MLEAYLGIYSANIETSDSCPIDLVWLRYTVFPLGFWEDKEMCHELKVCMIGVSLTALWGERAALAAHCRWWTYTDKRLCVEGGQGVTDR